jgi:hypothetical protein
LLGCNGRYLFLLVFRLNLFSKAFLTRHRLKLLFVTIWLHISLLDLFFVTYNGPVFLWQENAKLLTLVVHFLIAFTTVGLYWLINKYFKKKSNKNN